MLIIKNELMVNPKGFKYNEDQSDICAHIPFFDKINVHTYIPSLYKMKNPAKRIFKK